MSEAPDGAYDVVVPTIGRASLDALLGALSAQAADLPGRVVLVDDRRGGGPPLTPRIPAALTPRSVVVRSGGRGPAAARNRGWAATSAPWVAFVDDDVVPGPAWARDLAGDLVGAPADVGAVQGSIAVPLPAARRPTDRERNVARLASARGITADLAVRRAVLEELGGFDDRFRRAYREDTDLVLRAEQAGHRLAVGARAASHPVAPAPWWASVAAQRGNADDALLRAIHGPAALDRGRRRRHAVISAALLAAGGGVAARRWRLAALGGAAWALGTGELAWARIRPGPRTAAEVAAMVVTSAAIPPVACAHWLRGRWRWRDVAGGDVRDARPGGCRPTAAFDPAELGAS